MHLIRRPSDFFCGLIFFVVGVAALSIAVNYQLGTLRNMGPGYFPLLVSGLLALFGVFLVGKSFFGEGEEKITFSPWPLLLVLLSLTVFAVLLMPAGLFIATAVLVLIATSASGRFRLGKGLIMGLTMAAACVVAFVVLLGQQLPILGSWFAPILG